LVEDVMTKNYLERILRARVYDVARETPIDAAQNLSRRLGHQVLIKREDLQPVFSFKLRGAYNKIIQLSDEQRAHGVICASAGNHAQGVALAAQSLGIRAVIVMPKTTPEIKVQAVRERGARVVLIGDVFDESLAHALALAEAEGLTFVHPYDDPDVIAGQGTIGLEILRQLKQPPNVVFLPVGGGGLAAGVATLIKSVYPQVRIVTVEPEDAACFKAARDNNRRVTLKEVGLFADGVAVRQVGKETFALLRHHVDEAITVSNDEICAAIKDIFEDTRAIAEPAGAVALAGLKKWAQAQQATNLSLLAVLSGANTNFDRLRYVSERAELGERREAILAVTIPEQPGAFRALCQALGRRSITEFNYRYNDSEQAVIFVGVQIKDAAELVELETHLADAGYPVNNLTDNEMAKLHIRHLVGGHAPAAGKERLFRVEFPERPGALLKFLTVLGKDFNISLFHYRNHGADHGHVLVGFQVEKADNSKLQHRLAQLPYPCVEETDNPACQLFLH
jgi:threonine dehydratase